MRLLSNSINIRGAVFGVVVVCFFSSAAQGQYCSASGGGQQYISAVIVGNLVNTGTGSDGYADYTSMSTDIAVGESQAATIVNDLSITGSQCGIWVDWNADSDFDDAGETIAMSGGPASFTATIIAPGGTTAGDKRMRVRIMGTGSLTPCGNTTYGEVEDYTIAVVAPWTGSGDANDPYQIWTAADMQAIGADSSYLGAHFKLMADIDLSAYTGTSFNIIGKYVYYAPDNKPFTGVFDGNGHTISNFTYTSTGTDYIGLFGIVAGPSADIKDLGLINPNVHAGSVYVGSLVGRLQNASITNCYVEGGSVSGKTDVGGLVGYNVSGGTVSNCYATSSVSGNYCVGGLVGNNNGTITNCYSTGSVTGTTAVGGLVGSGATVYSSFWDIETSGLSTSAGGTGKTTAQMKDSNTYLYWGCGSAWTLNAGVDYPRLLWENAPGELLDAELADFVAGAGTEQDPYLIETGEQMNLVGLFWCEWDKHFKLMADIDLSAYTGTSFNIIGTDGIAFTGVFDGNGHTISNFTYTSAGTNHIGLFGYVDGPSAEIEDVGLVNPNVDAGTLYCQYVGSLVGRLANGTVSGCYVEGGSVSGNYYVGGLVGGNSGVITNCYSTASVSGNYYVGGLVGGNSGVITNCYSTASVSGSYIGGLVGKNEGTITNCDSAGSVSGYTYVGGLAGRNYDGIVTNCHSTGSVSGKALVGGLVGGNDGEISNCYSTGSVTESDGPYVPSNFGGLVGGNGGEISNCYSLGNVQGSTKVGGLVGGNGATITNCYSTGSVTGTTAVGGLVGWNEGSVAVSFWDIETSGQVTSGGGLGLTTAQMQDPSTFITFGGWDFVGESDNGVQDIWRLCNEGTEYPQLNWQFPLGDFVCPDGVDGIDLGVLCEEWLLEELSWDVWPDGGDGFVNFLDWAIFADGWQTTHDIFDLAEFADQWLNTGSNDLIADIAPAPDGDGIVNFLDFAALADNWLQ